MNEAAPIAPLLYTVRESARALSLSEASVFRLLRRGELPAVKVGHSLRLDPADLAAFVQRQKSGAPALAVVEGAAP